MSSYIVNVRHPCFIAHIKSVKRCLWRKQVFRYENKRKSDFGKGLLKNSRFLRDQTIKYDLKTMLHSLGVANCKKWPCDVKSKLVIMQNSNRRIYVVRSFFFLFSSPFLSLLLLLSTTHGFRERCIFPVWTQEERKRNREKASERASEERPQRSDYTGPWGRADRGEVALQVSWEITLHFPRRDLFFRSHYYSPTR